MSDLSMVFDQMFLLYFYLDGMRMSSALHRISSYNVLSSRLAEPEYFPSCSADYLAADYRLEGLLTKMEREVSREGVICLQEVSAEW